MFHVPKLCAAFASTFFLLCCNTQAADPSLPKQIAKDLVVESVEQGEFLRDPLDPLKFKRSDVLTKRSGRFGWRIKVATNRSFVEVQEKGIKPGESNGLPMRLLPHSGYVFFGSEGLSLLPRGKYTFRIFVESIFVKTSTFTVE